MKPISKRNRNNNSRKRKRNNNGNNNSKKRKINNNVKINIGLVKAHKFITKIESIIHNKKLNRRNELSDKEFYDLQSSIQSELIRFLRANTFWKYNPADLIQFIKMLEKHETKINKSNRPNPLIEIYHPLSLVLLYKYNLNYYQPDTNVINRIASYCDKDTGLYLKRYRQNGTIPRTYESVYNMLSKLQEECVVGIGPWLLPAKLNKKVSL